MIVYLIGALKNKKIPEIAQQIREAGHDVYDQWWCPGEHADLNWQEYCKFRGWSYAEALNEWHAKQVFDIDKFHLDRAEAGVVVLPSGKSSMAELGYLVGRGKPVYILVNEEPDRYDIMPRLATKAVTTIEEVIEELKHDKR